MPVKTEISPRPMPTVAMDIELGQSIPKGHTLEFDYDQFAHTAQAMGITPEQVDRLQVDVSHPKYMKANQGLFFPDLDNVWVKYNPDGQKMTKKLVHETQHYIDHLAGMQLKNEKIYSRINQRGYLAAAGLLGGLGAIATAFATRNTALFYTGAALAGPSWGAAAHYAREPLEVRARSAEKAHTDPEKPILSINKNQ